MVGHTMLWKLRLMLWMREMTHWMRSLTMAMRRNPSLPTCRRRAL